MVGPRPGQALPQLRHWLLLAIITSCIWKTDLIGCFYELQLTLIHLQLSFISNMKARSEILLNKSTESKESKSL